MYQIKIGNTLATLRLNEWKCDDPLTLRILRTLTRNIQIPGHVPDIEECIINGLRRDGLTFTVVKHRPPQSSDEELIY